MAGPNPTGIHWKFKEKQSFILLQLTSKSRGLTLALPTPTKDLEGLSRLKCASRLLSICRGETCSHRSKLELNSNLIPALGGLRLKTEPQSQGTIHFSYAEETSRLALWQAWTLYIFPSCACLIWARAPAPVPQSQLFSYFIWGTS